MLGVARMCGVRRPTSEALPAFLLLLGVSALAGDNLRAQDPAARPDVASGVVAVEVTPATAEVEVGQQLSFKAVGKDAAGSPADKAATWFALPFDLAAADQNGTLTVYGPGVVKVAAVIEGKAGFATVTVKPARVAQVEIEPPLGPLVVGGALELEAAARASNGNPRRDVAISWSSETPSVASVDAAGLVRGVAPGRATLLASAEEAVGTLTIEVAENPVRKLAIDPRIASVRTGDVVHFAVEAGGRGGTAIEAPFVRWSASGEGATIDPDGGFVAERAGTYAVTATSGDHVAVASVVVAPRDVERTIEVVGRGPVTKYQAAEQWIIGKHAYLSSIADRVWVYDVSDPAHPVKTDSLVVDARIVNDVSTTPDGKIGVLTREGASNRRNGIVFFDASDPAHPKVVSEYTETVTGGVHSAFIDGHYVYLTDDATGSLRVIDFGDVKAPKEVARWQVENPLAKTFTVQGESFSGGRSLHDVYVKDGLIYLAYWKDGLVILDVGNGIKGGNPESPQLVSLLRFNHHELYGPGWISGTHTVFRHKDYVFVGDEVLPEQFDIESRARLTTRGIIHVVDVSDIQRPRKVAEYSVPEAGAHNVWVADDVLYMGFTYGGGGRVLDVSGELRGDLYAQGREIARLWTGDPEGYRPNLPATWGAQPHEGLIFFNDINSGLWIARLGEPRDRGSTTAPGD
jgi:hypothetical protein